MAAFHSTGSSASAYAHPMSGREQPQPLRAQAAGPQSKSVRNGTSETGGAAMIEVKTGDILAEDAEALVNSVNCVGIMGRGVALQFKKAFPSNFKAYKSACERDEVQPGRMFVFETKQLTNPRYIINFPTKRHWR